MLMLLLLLLMLLLLLLLLLLRRLLLLLVGVLVAPVETTALVLRHLLVLLAFLRHVHAGRRVRRHPPRVYRAEVHVGSLMPRLKFTNCR
jgi:hypothetical protein